MNSQIYKLLHQSSQVQLRGGGKIEAGVFCCAFIDIKHVHNAVSGTCNSRNEVPKHESGKRNRKRDERPFRIFFE
jgi:hypothetical protein